MKIANISLITTPQDMSTSFNLPAMYVGNIVNYSIQLVFIGTPDGTFKLQLSNDHGSPLLPGATSQINDVVNFTDISGTSKAVSTSGTVAWDFSNIGYMWVRIVYTANSAGVSSLISARTTVKGV